LRSDIVGSVTVGNLPKTSESFARGGDPFSCA
jgi:hypothetical protein